MKFFSALAIICLATTAVAVPTGKRSTPPFPLPDGFPNPSDAQVIQIQQAAFGTLPNGPPPSNISTDGLTNLKLIALNELFEVAFFNELVQNVTNRVHGYDLRAGHEYALATLKAVVAQEELHALNANGALKKFGQEPIQPCQYDFPVSSFREAIALAATFTDVVLGTLQDVNQVFAKNGDDGLVRAVSSVIGNEAEQEGFYRTLLKKRPSSQPFLTTSARDFAFTAIQSFILPGSCPNINTIPLKTFKPLNVLTEHIQPASQNLQFSFAKADASTTDASALNIVYINQQNAPIVMSLQNAYEQDEQIVFQAPFPFQEFEMNGLTIAAVTKGAGPFANADVVANATLFGPGLIEIY
ncbi:hypothetical protein CC78DRAFT_531614 [Lojkania enalia]|uniref:Late sexual development protein n=1 Tax=Lojkania enalia TaxID=147567 RepID=A0A9P4N8T7_9PLEO|nr:hypothetical protein CC78DRAFT_531614 [Didymosphaeria enalia]